MGRRSRLGDYDPYQQRIDYRRGDVGSGLMRDAWGRYKKEFDDNSNKFDLTDRAQDALYTMTVLSAKPDPLGRHVLLDSRFNDDGRTYLVLTGKPTDVYAGVYMDSYDTKDDSSGDEYSRQHGYPGARVKKTGLGSAAYMASAANSATWYGRKGSFSPAPGSSGHNRSGSADKVWDALIKAGSAERESQSGTTETGEDDSYCVSVSGNDYDTGDYTGTIITDEVCGHVEYEYTTNDTIDFLPGTAIFEAGLFVWGIEDVHESLVYSDWSGRALPSSNSNFTQMAVGRRNARINLDLITDHMNKDGNGRHLLDVETCTLLARSYHGPSIRLILHIGDLLRRSAGEDAMVGYLRRLDIAHIAGSNQQYLELLGQQRIPGFEGVSLGAINEIRALHQAAGRGKLMVDMDSDNPLHLPPLSTRVQRKIYKLPSE